jgi:hypothetical protein
MRGNGGTAIATQFEGYDRRHAFQHTRDAARRQLALLRRSAPTPPTDSPSRDGELKKTENVMARRKTGPPKDETKSAKWSRLANRRLRLAIQGIDGLSKIATTIAYERTDAQVDLLVKALRAAVDRCERAYASGSDGTEIPVL